MRDLRGISDSQSDSVISGLRMLIVMVLAAALIIFLVITFAHVPPPPLTGLSVGSAEPTYVAPGGARRIEGALVGKIFNAPASAPSKAAPQ